MPPPHCPPNPLPRASQVALEALAVNDENAFVHAGIVNLKTRYGAASDPLARAWALQEGAHLRGKRGRA